MLLRGCRSHFTVLTTSPTHTHTHTHSLSLAVVWPNLIGSSVAVSSIGEWEKARGGESYVGRVKARWLEV